MVSCTILRKNKTSKTIRVKDSKDSFIFEKGTYYIMEKHIVLRKGIIGWRPTLFYVEGYSEPVSFLNIDKRKLTEEELKNIEDDDDKEIDTVLIDSGSIHNLTSRELLSVLTSTALTRMEMFTMIMMILIFLMVVANLGLRLSA